MTTTKMVTVDETVDRDALWATQREKLAKRKARAEEKAKNGEEKKKGRPKYTLPTGLMVKAYKFGCPFGPEPDCKALVEQQFVLSDRYQREHVKLACEKRKLFRDYRNGVIAEDLTARIDALTEQIRSAETTIKAASGKKQRKVAVLPGVKAHVKELKKQRAGLKKERTALNASLKSDPYIQGLNVEYGTIRYNALRAEFRRKGIAWGQYLAVEAAVKQASKEASDPEPHHYNGSGRIVVQLQKPGVTVAEAMRGDGEKIRIAPIPDGAYDLPRGERRRATRTVVELRIASQPEELWVRARTILHRPLPPDGVIKWAWLQARRIGPDLRWECGFVVESSTERHHNPPDSKPMVVALDFGAKGERKGYGVALALGEDGRQHYLNLAAIGAPCSDDSVTTTGIEVTRRQVGRLPPAKPGELGKRRRSKFTVADVLEHARGLQATRDKEFDVARDQLAAWLRTEAAPEWFRDETKTLIYWKSIRRLAKLVARWSQARFDGDEAIFFVMEAWRRQNRHLYQWAQNEGHRILAHRDEVYKIWSARLASQYSHAVMEDVNYAELRRKPTAEDGGSAGPGVNKTAARAAPGELRQFVILAMGSSMKDARALGEETRGADPWWVPSKAPKKKAKKAEEPKYEARQRSVMVMPLTGRASCCPVCDGFAEVVGTRLECQECGAAVQEDYARCWNLLKESGADTSKVELAWKKTVDAAAAARKARA